MKPQKKADIIAQLNRLKKNIMEIPIDLRDPQQIETLQFAAASVDDAVGFLNDITEVQHERNDDQ